MQSVMQEHYLWLKALHVISVIAWMAGILYLPRLFVYHAERAGPGSELSETFKVMELKLFRLIMNPAMIATWVFGLAMLWALGWEAIRGAYWLHAKLVLIAAITWFHHWLGLRRKEFARDANTRTGRSYRVMNEVPTLMMVAVVILVIVKPI